MTKEEENDHKVDIWVLESRLIMREHEVKCLDELKEANAKKLRIYKMTLRSIALFLTRCKPEGSQKIINYIEQITKD
jgi:hypothetical protein